MASGTVVRFDRRKGFGFVAPDDGGEDVFVHQNNINMEGFRYLQVGERVTYDLEVGQDGMKGVSVSLVEPRQPRREFRERGEREGEGDFRPRAPRPRSDRPDEGGSEIQKLRRKQERLITLLVEKGILAPGDIDGLEGSVAKSIENQQA